MNDYVEYVVTIHCKYCSEVVSLDLHKNYEDALKIIEKFKEDHEHPNPWFV